jgi:hypothetical protein
MIPVHTLSNQIESQVIEAALKEAGIHCVIRTFADSAYNGIFIPQQGYGQVLVGKADKQKAEGIIKEVLES